MKAEELCNHPCATENRHPFSELQFLVQSVCNFQGAVKYSMKKKMF